MDRSKDLEKLKEELKEKNKISIDEVENLLSWSHPRQITKSILTDWANDGEIILTKKGKVASANSHFRAKGIFNVVKNHFAFVDIENAESIFIPRANFNGALDGDEVLVKINSEKKEGKGYDGEVIKILKHRSDTVVGILTKHKNFGFVVPVSAFGSDIFIPKFSASKAKNGELVAVDITFWGDGENQKPEGRIKKVLGKASDSNNMIEALLLREGLEQEFPKEVLSEARSLFSIDSKDMEDEIKKRVDLRNLDIITIDGITAKDLDDAVYVKKLENGNYKLIVSIADVSHYVQANSSLDIEASRRGNSVYLVDRVLPMFPYELSNELCSLNEKEDKLTFTAEMEIDSNAEVLSSKIYKSVINSKHRMTYDDVNKILNGQDFLREKYADILKMLDEMLELSRIIRKSKYERGSIDFDLPEIRVKLGAKGEVEKIVKVERGESEKIIEDFMIVANETVARELEKIDMPAVYRTHEKPDSERIFRLNETLYRFGLRVEDAENVSPKEIQTLVEKANQKGAAMIVHKMILMSLKQARYTTKNIGHFGLASKSYTHFTSPIRRYSDLLVHRLLFDIISGKINQNTALQNGATLESQTKHISETERVAMRVEDESVRIKIVDYMKDKVDNVYLAKVVGFNNRKVFFETEEFVECSFNIADSSDYYEFDEKEFIMKNLDYPKCSYYLGDSMKIKIKRVDMLELEIAVLPLREESNIKRERQNLKRDFEKYRS